MKEEVLGDLSRSVQPQKARRLEFEILVEEELYYPLAKTKVLYSCAETNCTANLCLCFGTCKYWVFS